MAMTPEKLGDGSSDFSREAFIVYQFLPHKSGVRHIILRGRSTLHWRHDAVDEDDKSKLTTTEFDLPHEGPPNVSITKKDESDKPNTTLFAFQTDHTVEVIENWPAVTSPRIIEHGDPLAGELEQALSLLETPEAKPTDS